MNAADLLTRALPDARRGPVATRPLVCRARAGVRARDPFPSVRVAALIVACSTSLACASGSASPQVEPRTPAEHEALFLSVPSRDFAEAWVRRLSARPHLAGTPEAHATADSLASWLSALGFDVVIETFHPYLPHPGNVSVTITAPDTIELETREPAGRVDVADTAAVLTSWLAYAANGVVEAPVVYANYGLPADYAALERAGIAVRDAIVLARFGGAYRGVKIAEAAGRGAAGVILYPDPAEDGFTRGDTIPLGPFRPPWSVQRGTLMEMWVHTGDPLTPGRPAVPGEPRLSAAEATNLPSIPATVIGYGEAMHILSRMEGIAIDGFRGGLPVEYLAGSGSPRVRLEVRHQWAQRPIHNVIARVRGASSKHVVLGNHFDAWVAGAADPHTGTAALLEIARGIAALQRDGWTPRRGITLAFWDAEEFGVIGSTEWVEAHAEELARDAVAYFNVDMFTAGTLDVTGSPALRDLVHGAAAQVKDPITGRSMALEWEARQRATWERREVAEGDTFAVAIGDIGAGSDWTAFLHHAGVPSLQWTTNGRGRYAVYHSVLDDFEYYRDHVDSAFVHTPSVAQVMGLAALRLADADVLPFRHVLYADRIERWLEGREAEARRADVVVDLTALRSALGEFRAASIAFAQRQSAAAARGDTAAVRRANELQPRVEAAFLEPGGLIGRPWYRHVLNAPGSDTGYDPLPLPELAEAILAHDDAAATRALARIERALNRATALLNQ